MIKRRFYKLEHNDKDEGSVSSSSSSSDSEAEAQQEEEEEDEVTPQVEVEEEEVDIDQVPQKNEEKPTSPSSGSGYESEDSSEKELEYDSSGMVIDDDEEGTRSSGRDNAEILEPRSNKLAKDDSSEADYYILKCKSVYKCRICPRIVCLTEESLRSHLNSKRHTRSEKLLKEGRLKFMLNSDGEIEEDQETHAERYARTMTIAQDSNKKKKNEGRQRQKQRLRLKRKNMGDAPDKAKAKEPAKKPTKKRRKDGD